MPAFSISLLGPFQAIQHGQPLRSFRTNKAQALLAYLVVESMNDPELAHRRTNLMTLLWPDLALESAQVNLRQTVYRLRKTISDITTSNNDNEIPFILAERQTIQINPDYVYTADATQFVQLITQVQSSSNFNSDQLTQLETAMRLYQGDFLADFYLDDSEAFEEWAGLKRAEFRRMAIETLDTLADNHIMHGNYDQAQQYAHQQLKIDNLRENAYRQLMLAQAQSGQRSEALAQYETCRQVLADELGVEPEDATDALAAQIRAGALENTGIEKPKSEETIPKHQVIQTPKHNLPQQPTAFIGRTADVQALSDLLADKNIRLITIIGAGGIGKTRLALTVAEHCLSRATLSFPDGIYFVQLAAIQKPKHIVPTIAQAISLQATSDIRKDTLVHHLQSHRMLLILDNFEHLIDGVDLVIDILHQAPNVKLIITSKERINLHEEQVYPIRGLGYPDEQVIKTQPADEIIATYPAIQLFHQSAQRIQPNFQIMADDLPVLAQICQLVTGIPLALELAATWIDTLPLDNIATEIAQNLDFLETDIRNIPNRHRSMRAVFDASWQRLTETEQQIYAQLSVFRGHFTRDAARIIAGASLRQLATLAYKSLLLYNKTQDRYEIHELLSQYATEQLAETPEMAHDSQQRHSEYYCTKLATQTEILHTKNRTTALTEIAADIPNIKAAWRWAIEQNNINLVAQAIHTLCEYYEWSHRAEEGDSACRLATSQLTPPPANMAAYQSLVINILIQQTKLNRHLGRNKIAHQILSEALALIDSMASAQNDMRRERALAYQQLGWLAFDTETYQTAIQHHEQSLELYRELRDTQAIASALNILGGIALSAGDLMMAKTHYLASLALARINEDPDRLAATLEWVGSVARDAQDYSAARSLYEESLTFYQATEADAQALGCLLELVDLAILEDDVEATILFANQGLTLAEATGDAEAIAVFEAQLADG